MESGMSRSSSPAFDLDCSIIKSLHREALFYELRCGAFRKVFETFFMGHEQDVFAALFDLAFKVTRHRIRSRWANGRRRVVQFVEVSCSSSLVGCGERSIRNSFETNSTNPRGSAL